MSLTELLNKTVKGGSIRTKIVLTNGQNQKQEAQNGPIPAMERNHLA